MFTRFVTNFSSLKGLLSTKETTDLEFHESCKNLSCYEKVKMRQILPCFLK